MRHRCRHFHGERIYPRVRHIRLHRNSTFDNRHDRALALLVYVELCSHRAYSRTSAGDNERPRRILCHAKQRLAFDQLQRAFVL